MSDEMARYQERLDALLYSDSSDIFANYSQDHARRIIRSFFAASKDTIVCLSGDFGLGVYNEDDIAAELREAVRRGVRVSVISLGTSEASRTNLRTLKDNLDRLAAESKRGGSFVYKLGVVSNPNATVQHYLISDSKRYRLEAPHRTPVNEGVHAEVCCNGPAKAAVLARDFSAVWERLSIPR